MMGNAYASSVVSQDAAPDAPNFAETVALVARYAGGVPVAANDADLAWLRAHGIKVVATTPNPGPTVV